MAVLTFLAVLGIPALMLVFTVAGGGREVMKRQGGKPWRWWEYVIGFGFLFALAGATPESGLFLVVLLAPFAVARALQLVWWGVRARKSAAERPAHLADASSQRLLGAGLGLLVLTAVLAGAGCRSGLREMRKHGMLRLSEEAHTRRGLAELRGALSVCYDDAKGKYPPDLSALTAGGKYLRAVPPAKTPPYHDDSSKVRAGAVSDDAGGWLYDAASGRVSVNCTHTDMKDKSWTEY